MRVLIVGGAGFVGSQLASLYRERRGAEVVCFDNLKRRGSELNLERFHELGIEFVHGDLRSATDLESVAGEFDLLVEAAAEPSVHAGTQGDAGGIDYVIDTNLLGATRSLEFARRRAGFFVFLSTSRVYSIAPLRAIELTESKTRFEIAATHQSGLTDRGVDESFPTDGPRSLYGATKLAAEHFVQEYADLFDLPSVINRCGVIAGAGQFGRVDQGVFTLWVARHLLELPLRYTGFGGEGRQVRDLLHPRDLWNLIERQTQERNSLRADLFNVGGGLEISTSLAEYTEHCRAVTGRRVEIAADPETRRVDIPLYLSDTARARDRFGWSPEVGVREIVTDIHGWLELERERGRLRRLFG